MTVFNFSDAEELVSNLMQLTKVTANRLGVNLENIRMRNMSQYNTYAPMGGYDPYSPIPPGSGGYGNEPHHPKPHGYGDKDKQTIKDLTDTIEKMKKKHQIEIEMLKTESHKSQVNVETEESNDNYRLVHTNSVLFSNTEFEVTHKGIKKRLVLKDEIGGIIANLDQVEPGSWVARGSVIGSGVKLINGSDVCGNSIINGNIKLDNTIVDNVTLTGEGSLTNCAIIGKGNLCITSDMTGLIFVLGDKAVIRPKEPVSDESTKEK